MDSYDLMFNTKVVQTTDSQPVNQNQPVTKITTVHRLDLSVTNLLAVGEQSSNCLSKMKSIDKTTWPPEAQNRPKCT